MASILIKNLPVKLHEKLHQRAAQHHRSMNREVIAILEHELSASDAALDLEPVKLRKPISGEEVVEMIRKFRESRP